MQDTLEEHGLAYGEWKVLCNLHFAADGTSTPGELSHKLELSSGAMTNRLDQLERTGSSTGAPTRPTAAESGSS